MRQDNWLKPLIVSIDEDVPTDLKEPGLGLDQNTVDTAWPMLAEDEHFLKHPVNTIVTAFADPGPWIPAIIIHLFNHAGHYPNNKMINC